MSNIVIDKIKKPVIGQKLENGYTVISGPEFRQNNKEYYLFKCNDCGEEKWLDYYWGLQSKHAYCRGKVDEFLPVGTVVGMQTIVESPRIVKTKMRYGVRCNECLTLTWRTLQTVERKDLGCITCANKKKSERMAGSDNDRMYKRLMSNVKSNARNRGMEFALSIDDIKELADKNCHYCGGAPERRKMKDEIFFCNGIDRIDSSLGYIKNNCVSCCKQCNLAKLDYSVDEFLKWVVMVYRHNYKESE